jgi:hypothetical protein
MANTPEDSVDGEQPLRKQQREGRRRKRPNPWRCLLPLRYAAYAILLMLALHGLESAVCWRSAPIEEDLACLALVPEWLHFTLMVVVAGAAIACAYQWWCHLNRVGYYRLD